MGIDCGGGLQFGVHSLAGHTGDGNVGDDGQAAPDSNNPRDNGVWVPNIGGVDPSKEGWNDGDNPREFAGRDVRRRCTSDCAVGPHEDKGVVKLDVPARFTVVGVPCADLPEETNVLGSDDAAEVSEYGLEMPCKEPEVEPAGHLESITVPETKLSQLRLWLRAVEEVMGREALLLESSEDLSLAPAISSHETEGAEDIAVAFVGMSWIGEGLVVLGDLNSGELLPELRDDEVVQAVMVSELLLRGGDPEGMSNPRPAAWCCRERRYGGLRGDLNAGPSLPRTRSTGERRCRFSSGQFLGSHG